MKISSRDSQTGDIMLLWIVALFVLISVVSLLSAVVVSRALYVGKTMNSNKAVLDLEDSNISYRRELAAFQMEAVELVTFYFGNSLFQHPTTAAFAGAGPHASNHNMVLRTTISPQMQREIYNTYNAMFELKYNAIEASGSPTDPVEINELARASLTSEVTELSNLLYTYLVSYRCMSDGITQNHDDYNQGLPFKYKQITYVAPSPTEKSIHKRFGDEGIVFTYHLQLTGFGFSAPLLGGESYLGRFRSRFGTPDDTDPALGTVAVKTKLDLRSSALGAALDGINYEQNSKIHLFPANFSTAYTSGTYQLTEQRGAQREQVEEWTTRAVA